MASNDNSTRTRTLIIIIIIMLSIGIIVGVYSFSSGNKNTKMVSPTSGIPNNIYVTPGAKSSEKYAKLQQDANVAGTKKADAQGKTFIPTILGNKSDDAINNFNDQLNNILKKSDNSDNDKLSKQLAALLAELGRQGHAIEDLLRLIRELQQRGYNVSDLEALIKKLMAEGYNADALANLLKNLQNQGYKVSDLENMLRRLLKEGYDPELINKILDQLLKDKLKALEDAIKQLQNAGYDTSNMKQLEHQVNNPDLTKLLEQLANQGYKVDSLENLLKQLMDKGYNIFDWNMMLQQLQKDGYDVRGLQSLLDKLKAQGIDISNLKNLLDALTKKDATNAAQLQTLQDLLNKLQAQGADLDKLKKLLADLQHQGYSQADLEKLIADLIKKGLNPDDIYNELLKKLNMKTAEATPDSSLKNQLHNIFNTKHPKSSEHEPNDLNKEYAALIKSQHDAAIAAEQARKLNEANIIKHKQMLLNTEAQQKAINEMLNNMRAESDLVANTLSKIPPQAFTQGDLAAGKDNDNNKSSSQQSTVNTLLAAQTNAENNNDIIKAGSILFAVLETAVNSDEPGPILARIVQPPLKNTKLIGTVQANNANSETLTLMFSTANIPERLRTYGVSAVAIDPNTARTALASDVDHHYLLRWGSIFAASFLQGYSSAVAQSGTTVSASSNGAQTTSTTTQTALNPRQQVFKGVGDMATAWGQGISSLSNRPNTIKIDAGVSIGVLFTSDFSIPSNDATPNTNTSSLKQPTLQPAATPTTAATIQQPIAVTPTVQTPSAITTTGQPSSNVNNNNK
ncbi:MAG: TrbI/VirB10 family protein [Gammaproteobacteria bacterium]